MSYPLRRFAHVFEGGGYGVGLTVNPVGPLPGPDVPPPDGVQLRPARLGELMPVEARSDAEMDAELERIARVEGAIAAYKAEIVTCRARRRSSSSDRQAGQVGAASPDWAPHDEDDPLPGVSEFFPDELAMTLNCSRASASTLAEVSVTLVERLPASWAALADGHLDWPRARALALELGWPARECEPDLVAEVEAAVLPGAMQFSVTKLRALVQRELLARDAAAADRRRRQAEKNADVTLRSAPDGMSELNAFGPAPLNAAIRETLDTYARMAKAAGDPRSLGQLRFGVLGDLVLRSWDTSRPPVTAHLTVLAPLDALRPPDADDAADAAGMAGSRPAASTAETDGEATAETNAADAVRQGFAASFRPAPVAEVNGRPITATQVRELLEQLDALCPGGLQAPLDGSLGIALTELVTGELRAVVTRGELERSARRGCPDHPRPEGQGDCSCPILDRPSAVDRYRPTPAHYRYTRTRDRTCRHPGCGNRAGWADLDHVVPHAHGGRTDCDNLCCLCRRHHRLKTHASGWRFELARDGTLSVTTPTGVTRTTRPPGLDLLRDHLRAQTGRSPGPPPDDDPPPF